MPTLFPLPDPVTIPIVGEGNTFPIHRIFCVGRNYEAHAKEMGNEVDRAAPWYFTKSPASAALSGAVVPFAKATQNYHHEVELVLAIGAVASDISVVDAPSAIFGYASGLDMTRRDLQAKSKEGRKPWCTAKDVENGAVFSPITRAVDFAPKDQRIHVSVNGDVRQDASLAEMVWSPAEVIAHLSTLYTLRPGDLIMTGTPAGVGQVQPGDKIHGGIDGLSDVVLTLT